jgi:hypothetical protein
MKPDSAQISERVRKFIIEYVDTFEMLRVLVLLYESQERGWTTTEITQELRSAEGAIEKRLSALYDRKILARKADGGDKHQFSPFSEDMKAIIADLVDSYHVRPYWIIDLIYSRPPESLKAFADAFRIKKED